MTNQQHIRGEEYTAKVEAGIISPATQITFGLYNDSDDNLSNTDDLSAINSEPTSGNYSRKTFDLSSSNFSAEKTSGDNWRYVFSNAAFDVENTTEEVDSYFAVIEFNGDGDSSATPHLVFTGSLGGTENLADYFTLNVDEMGRVQEGV